MEFSLLIKEKDNTNAFRKIAAKVISFEKCSTIYFLNIYFSISKWVTLSYISSIQNSAWRFILSKISSCMHLDEILLQPSTAENSGELPQS